MSAADGTKAILLWDDPVLRVTSDPPRRAHYRALQSWYRETVLKVPPGLQASGQPLGSLLPAEREREGLNFLDEEITSYAERRAIEVLREGGTLELDRLRRNLLSSMPLCFNLFGKLRAEPQTAARVLGRVLDLDIATIDEVLVEYAPAAGKAALKDRTAFDAFVAYRTSSGGKGFLGVETKYTEPFSPTIYPANRYEPLDAYQTARFRPGAAQRLARPATNQLWRNVLLAAATRADGGFRIGHAVVIAGQDDQAARRAVSALKAELDDPDGLLRSVSLERLVEECLGEPLLAGWAAEFRRRYLDLSPIAECFPLRTVATRRSRAPLQAADSEKVRQLAAHCRTALGELTNLVDPPGYPDSLAMCLLDAIWSMGVRYTAVVRVVNRYRQHRDGLGADPGRDGLADLLTTIDLAGSPAAFADLVGNRQRTATQNGVLKADAVQVAARLLAGQGIDTTGDLHAAIRAGHARQLEGIWRTVPGQRSGISWRYLLMLAGVAEVKPDRMIRRFVAAALGVADVDPQTAASLLVQLQRARPVSPCAPSTTPSGSTSVTRHEANVPPEGCLQGSLTVITYHDTMH